MNNKEARDRLISLKMSYKIRIEEEDIEALDMGAEALENQKIGHWIKSKDRVYLGECSVCKREVGELFGYIKKFYNYCPYCGAKMKGERK